MQFLPKPHQAFWNVEKLILKCTWDDMNPRIAKTRLIKKNKVEGITLYNLILIIQLWQSRKCDISRSMDRCVNGTEYRPQK